MNMIFGKSYVESSIQFTLTINLNIINFRLTTYTIYESSYLEYKLYFGAHSTNFHKSKICKLQLCHDSYANQNINIDKRIIEYIKENLKNKILTLKHENNYCPKVTEFILVQICSEKINEGYVIRDPLK